MLDRTESIGAVVASRPAGLGRQSVKRRIAASHAARPTSWALLISYSAILAFLVIPNDHRFPAIILSASAFALMPLFFPHCRPVLEAPVCPLNWALLIFFLQLIALPLMITFGDVSPGTLPFLPSDDATNMSLLVSTLGYVAFCAAYQICAARNAPGPSGQDTGVRWVPPGQMTLLYAAIGLVGLLLNFGSLGGVVSYFTSAQAQGSLNIEAAATVRSAAPLFLKPFLGVAFVMVWCKWVDRYGATSTRISRLLATGGTALLVALVYATFSFNRGSFAVPLVSMAAVYMARVRRMPIKVMAAIALAAIVILVVSSFVRGDTSAATSGQSDQPAQPTNPFLHASHFDLNGQVQVYGAAPQFVGFLLERTGYARDPYWGSTLLSSAVYPVPILGKPFRSGSGVVIYNQLIYGPVGNLDQNLPIQGELFINFRVVGVIVGFFLLGYAAARLQRAFLQARTALEAYFWVYASIWMLFQIVGSLSAAIQTFIYFCWPLYGYFILKFALARRPRRYV